MRNELVLLVVPAIVAAAMIEGACTIVNGLAVPTEAGAPPADDAGGDVDPCNHALPPDKNPTAPSGGDIVFTTVGKEYYFSPKDDAGVDIPVGFDIDRTCTCPDVESCVPAKPRQASCDQDDRGRDDALRPIVEFAKSPPYSLDIGDQTTGLTAKGSGAVLVQISSYNGQADDAEITVAAMRSPGLRDVYDDGGIGPKRVPTFTVADKWTTLPEEATDRNGVILPLRPITGYVRDWTAVVRSDIAIQIAKGITLYLSQALVTGHIVKLPDGTFTIDRGTVTARIAVRDAIRAFGAVEEPPGSGQYLCLNPSIKPVFDSIKKQACEAADVAGNASLDRTGAPCTAISAAFDYIAAPASLGPPITDQPNDVCADASVECPP